MTPRTIPRIVIVGGTGGFGRRLVDGLIATSDLHLVIAARNLRRVEQLAGSLPSGRASASALDASTVTAEQLRALDAAAVVDAAGPFQGSDYRLARAAIDAGLHYLDLADARDFVGGFATLDAAAKQAGVVALSGASSTPALSNAVLDRLTAGWQRIETIEIGISPGNKASPRGLSLIQAILSYAGKPIRVFDDGTWEQRPGWGMTVRRDIPGVGRRWLSLCETPDLDLVPARYAPRAAAIFRGGQELTIMHLGLLAATLPVRAGLLGSLRPLAGLFRWGAERLAGFGSDVGGMLVEASGVDAEGRRVQARWSLAAVAGDGPFVPTLPARAALHAIIAGALPPGASACVGILSLEQIEREFAGHRISTEVRTTTLDPPFQRLLGAGFAQLPDPVRRIHSLVAPLRTEGRAEIVAARNPVARLLCWFAGLPAPGTGVPVSVTFVTTADGGDLWQRQFRDRRYASTMLAGEGTRAGLLVEKFWPFTYYHTLTPSPRGVAWTLVAWSLLGVPLPRWTVPALNCVESAEGERYRFDIDVAFPLVGPVIRYRGWLLPAPATPSQ